VKVNSLSRRLIACSFQFLKADSGCYVTGQHSRAGLAVHLKDILGCFDHTDSHLLRIMTDHVSSNYSMTSELQSTPEASAIEWPALRNHIPCMAHIIQLAIGAFMSTLGVKGRTKSWEAHECGQQFGVNESVDIGKSQTLRKEGYARIDKVLAMKLGLAKIIEKVCISRYFETAETDIHIAEDVCCIVYANTRSSK